MKRKTTKEIMAESFRELAAAKSIDKITVQEIVDNCSYSTATFYRHFRDKYDLIAWDYARQTAEIVDGVSTEHSWRQMLLDAARHYAEEREYLTNLLLHTSGHDAFIQHMAQTNYNVFVKHLRTRHGQVEWSGTMELLARTYCLGTVCLSCEWILGKHAATPEELAAVYEAALPLPFRALLLPES
ncbi:MAG: TetR/AcrR family transcriptional regulator [Oscillospiraceae bacterium]|nr:TetR/AcrR family transcriptional regulator [Oscillospiraceae bacterium]